MRLRAEDALIRGAYRDKDLPAATFTTIFLHFSCLLSLCLLIISRVPTLIFHFADIFVDCLI